MKKNFSIYSLFIPLMILSLAVFGIVNEVNAEQMKSKWGDNPKQISNRLDSVSKLLEKSAGAKRISSSGNPDAIALRDQARSQHRAAYKAYNKGNYSKAKNLLGQATQSMFKAMSQADGGASNKAKVANDFERRLKSINVLLTAWDRISKEKSQKDKTRKDVNSTIQAAKKLKHAGKLKEGRSKLDEAYIMAKLGIEKLRRGDTLVRSLHFESKEEEYHYEVDRNDTHKMLVKMLLANKSDRVKKMAAMYVKKATELRKKADKLAAKKKFKAAVSVLEESTKGLVRAIRIGGVYIPG
ncbi:MAG: hypothetical protein HQL69_01920 [Magnetococcales bacterium]|nr:hypothetical protein [Magnetococcales bacterium]